VPWPWRFAGTISWRALVDIALMTFLVYQVSLRFRVVFSNC
jgi:hypothetical protein